MEQSSNLMDDMVLWYLYTDCDEGSTTVMSYMWKPALEGSAVTDTRQTVATNTCRYADGSSKLSTDEWSIEIDATMPGFLYINDDCIKEAEAGTCGGAEQ
jgi:hypothetical protein